MIDLHGQISLDFLKKRRFTGSYQGMRYLLRKSEQAVDNADKGKETKTVIEAVIWPEPFSYDATEEEKKHKREFAFCQEGIWEAVGWLNEEYKAGHF